MSIFPLRLLGLFPSRPPKVHSLVHRSFRSRFAPVIRPALLAGLLSTFALGVAAAQSFSVIDSFTALSGESPQGALIHDSAGNLYGTTPLGGQYSHGTVFKIDNSHQQTVLYDFGSNSPDGYFPVGGLVLSGHYLYGTTEYGSSAYGSIFRIDLTQSEPANETIVYSFSGPDGAAPTSSLVLDPSAQYLYGTTTGGGVVNCPSLNTFTNYGCGTVFKFDLTSGTLDWTYAFGTSPGDGAGPYAGLVLDHSGSYLYGATANGGNNACTSFGSTAGCGTVFRIDTATGMNESALYAFSGTAGDGAFPAGTLALKGNTLYGVTYRGGPVSGYIYPNNPGPCSTFGNFGCGTAFKIDVNGNAYKVLHTFGSSNDGSNPIAGLTEDRASGIFYGVTYEGPVTSASPGAGTVLRMNVSGNETVLYTLNGTTDGLLPIGSPTIFGNTLYGTTAGGGSGYPPEGTVFQYVLPTQGGNK
jgi:uncharacterized repeat protein (TIGR03803 family)